MSERSTELDPRDAMPEVVGPLSVEPVVEEPEDETEQFLERRLGIGFWLAIAWVVLVTALALLAPLLPIDGVNQSVGGRLDSPSLDHWFGTDANGRDVFARTIWGARVSLSVGFIAIVLGFVVGGSLGMLAGFFKGWVDKIISFVFLSLLSFPALVLALLIVKSLDRSLSVVALTIGILAIAPVGRLARAFTLVYAEREFVQAARVIGARNGRILIRELLPNVAIPMAALSLLGVAVAIVAEGGLAFLGLSVESGATWGKMILLGADASTLRKAPHVSMFPILVLFVTVLALNYAGDRIRAYFDVRETAF